MGNQGRVFKRFAAGRSIPNSCLEIRRGFTLWELLVVLLVIFLLIGLLTPAMNRVRMQSVEVICNSYFRQLGIAGFQYLQENEGLFPAEPNEWLFSEESINREHPIGCRWHDRVMAPDGEMMRQTETHQGAMWMYVGPMHRPCPTFRRFGASRGCENEGHNKSMDIEPINSYTMNGYLGTTRPGGVLKVTEVRDQAAVFFFSEENPWSIKVGSGKTARQWPPAALSTRALDDSVLLISPTDEARDCFATYHDAPSGDLNRGSANMVFVDGHVDQIDAEDQLRGSTGRGRSRLGPRGNLSLAWASRSEPPGGWEGQ